MNRIEAIGRVRAFFSKPSAAAVTLTAPLKVGDAIYVKGHTTDFQQRADSLEVSGIPVSIAAAGQSVGLRVTTRCRPRDVVYKVTR